MSTRPGGQPPSPDALPGSAAAAVEYVKRDVTAHEVAMQRRALERGVPCPEIVDWDPDARTLTMRRLPGMSVSDFYGENASAVPSEVFSRIRRLVEHLVDVAGLDFPDLTGYNIMVYNEQMWIIDFEHAREVQRRDDCCEFVQRFLAGEDSWNAEFA